MQEIMLAIVLGIAVGLANLLSYKIKFYLSKLSTLCLCTMLFCLGAKIGCDDALLAKLGTLGVQAGAIAFGAVCGSILFYLPLLNCWRARQTQRRASNA